MSDINLVTFKRKVNIFRRIGHFLKTETVLSIAIIAALLSMFFVHPSFAYNKYIDYKVLACLFSLMVVVSGLRKTGVFDSISSALTRFSGTLRKLALTLVMITFFASMAITNDVALITFIPLSLLVLKDISDMRSRITIITLQTIAANIGSSLTPVGNPQNLYLFSFYHMSARVFFITTFPLVFSGGILLILSVLTVKNIKIKPHSSRANQLTKPFNMLVYLVLFVISVLAVFRIIDFRIATGIVIIALILFDRKLFAKIDYSLLFTFAGFFIFIGNLEHIEPVRKLMTEIAQKNVLLVTMLSSQIVSNVPAAILLSRFTDDFASIIRGVSIGGMGTIISSLASVITYKFFVREYPGENMKFLRIFSFWNFSVLAVLYFFCVIAY
jgi:Na+/H+ antiporter NhaD/arsenite permease-like protein